MTAKELAELCAKISLEKKAENIVMLDLEGKSSVADYFLVMSAMTDRQVNAIAKHISDTLRTEGVKVLHEEGVVEGRWALLDFGDVVVHVFQDALRDYYHIESLWPNAPRKRFSDEAQSFQYNFNTGSAHY